MKNLIFLTILFIICFQNKISTRIDLRRLLLKEEKLTNIRKLQVFIEILCIKSK